MFSIFNTYKNTCIKIRYKQYLSVQQDLDLMDNVKASPNKRSLARIAIVWVAAVK
jgi:hypothetical protein